MFIATYDSTFGTGNTLEEAWEQLRNEGSCDDQDDVTWFEATEIQVEFKIIKKEVPIKSKATKEL